MCLIYDWNRRVHMNFVCSEFSILFENFSIIWRRRHCRWRAASFDLCSALMAIDPWGFFSVPHLLWHRASVYNGHLRVSVTHTYCRAFGMDLSHCFRGEGSNCTASVSEKLGVGRKTINKQNKQNKSIGLGFSFFKKDKL